ncbi:COG4223 family protein [Aliiroseovarius sp. S253]|uniref:COG4223 family protein n=1 Tax=Aliiroseovarius sp. S253 TaxID=3415133 RepID=UPI003C7CAE28
MTLAKSPKTAKAKTKAVEDAVVVEETKLDEEQGNTPEDPTNGETLTEPEQGNDTGADDADRETGEDLPTDEAEETSDKEPEKADIPVDASDTPAPIIEQKRESSFLPMLLGGAIVAALGFGAARYPDQWPFAQAVEDPVIAEMAALQDRIAGLESSTAAQSDSLDALAADDSLDRLRGETSGTMDELRTQLDSMTAKLGELENRIHTVEKLPQGSGMEAAAAAATAYERELQQMRQMLDTELARITSQKEDAQTLEVSAAETARAAGARAAMSRVHAALETGQPFGDALFDLTENAGLAAPDALSSIAADGVATQQGLQSSFPEAARASLDAAIRAAVEGGSMDRVSAFFRTQLGTRSLEPKEGDDPDAILSRAEAALKAGQVDTALTELAAMPEAGQPALADWIASATQRRDALAAATDLSTQLNTN